MSLLQEENRLIRRLAADDASAFDTLFDRYGKRLYAFALKYLRSETEAEELVQEVFVRLWENRRSLKTGHSFKSYLFTVALNQIRKHFNKKAVALRYLAQQAVNQQEEDNETSEAIDYSSILKRVEEIIGTFPERKKQIFLLSRREGKTSKEIAVELNITAGTVDNQVSDALRIIRETLQKEDPSVFATLLFLALF